MPRTAKSGGRDVESQDSAGAGMLEGLPAQSRGVAASGQPDAGAVPEAGGQGDALRTLRQQVQASARDDGSPGAGSADFPVSSGASRAAPLGHLRGLWQAAA